MEYKNFLIKKQGSVVILTFNRPEVRNAMNMECWAELGGFFDAIEQDESTHVVILTGAGEKAFVAGADLNSLKTRTALEALNAVAQGALKKIEDSCKIVIAAVNGFAFGGGCEIALACDIRLVSENAVFALPEASLGILPGAGGTQRLSKLIGIGRAKEVILAGRNISAQEAVQFGLAYKCTPQPQLMDTTMKVAGEILKRGPLALRLCKQLIAISMSTDREAGMLLEIYGFSLLMGSKDKAEGVNAFLEKRKPEYHGR